MSIYKYGNHELQQIKVWNYNGNNENTYIYIHGGAWRDPSNTYDELESVAKKNQNSTFIGINYRLSPEIKHPQHYNDVYDSLVYIKKHFKLGNINLLGYSVGATLILQIIQNLNNLSSPILFKSIKFLDGIYDIKQLIEEYPHYGFFIDEAFQNLEIAIDSVSLIRPPIISKNTSIIICQSLQDDLLSINQTNLLVSYFARYKIPFTLLTGNWGIHDDIYGPYRNEIFIKT
ncbi:BNA7 [Candida jiufengensis]|uniref:BNA7 n=1 Tax=Candida jiufengensis TaxID=497108 RepID=UPI002224C300|nr:BNA7 [Candida jiufengensis]KAI5954387.1 BNA7 [Candida jiufengensis]